MQKKKLATRDYRPNTRMEREKGESWREKREGKIGERPVIGRRESQERKSERDPRDGSRREMHEGVPLTSAGMSWHTFVVLDLYIISPGEGLDRQYRPDRLDMANRPYRPNGRGIRRTWRSRRCACRRCWRKRCGRRRLPGGWWGSVRPWRVSGSRAAGDGSRDVRSFR